MKTFQEFLNEQTTIRKLNIEDMYTELTNSLLSSMNIKGISKSDLNKKGSKYKYSFSVENKTVAKDIMNFKEKNDRNGWRSFYEKKAKRVMSKYNINIDNLNFDNLAGVGWMVLDYTGGLPDHINISVVLKPNGDKLDISVMIDQKGKVSDIKTVLADTLGVEYTR